MSMEKEKDKNINYPAFSTQGAAGFYHGLTKREYAAIMAMKGFAAAGYIGGDKNEIEKYAKRSVECADEIFKQLEKQKTW